MTSERKETLGGTAVLLAFVALCAVAAMTATGCAFKVPPVLNPVGWFKPDPLKKIGAVEDRIFISKVQLVQIAQGLLAATIVELESVPRPDAPTLHSLEYAKRAMDNLTQAMGPIAPATARATEQMVKLRASTEPNQRAKGEQMLAKIDAESADKAATLFKTRQLLDALREKEADALKRARVAEGQRDALIFWVKVAGVGYLFFAHVLPRLAELHPATAGLARIGKLFAHTGTKA